MNGGSTRNGLAWGVVGLVVGVLIGTGGGGMWSHGLAVDRPPFLGFGVPGLVGLWWGPMMVFIAFWVLLIGGLLWGMGRIGPGRYQGRLEDLPADFDDWHRRAHERMREAAPADDSGRRG